MNAYCIALITNLIFNGSPLYEEEVGKIGTPIRLTNPAQFLKAGEAYFDHGTKRVIFQAIEHPIEGEEPSSDYSMYIGDLELNDSQAITGLTSIRMLSKAGSANTCGWFHPSDDSTVLFATTTNPTTNADAPGYQRGTGKYRWAFPPEMNIVVCDLENDDQTTPLITDEQNYVAEGSWSPDGRHILYCSLATGDGDIYVKDQVTGKTHLLVSSIGYDGGPFFSPDGKRITYRSDRRGNDLLQLFVGELTFNDEGTIVGLSREFQITDNAHVNWGPFWHPTGQFLLYTTSEVGHHNYEIYIIDADHGAQGNVTKYGTRKRRITHAPKFDGLPVFNSTGHWLMWTSKRETDTSQLWVAPFVFDVDAAPQDAPLTQ